MLHVALPYDYDTHPEKHYPMMFLCDGYYDFALVRGFYGNLIYDKVIPQFILVGVGYPGQHDDYGPLRSYDYSPVPELDKDPEGKHTGHGPEFLCVLETEIIPFVEREYPVDPSCRVLDGSSLGDLFAL